MVTIKAIDAATWAALDEIDIVEGDNLIPELTGDTYRLVRADVASVVVPTLTAGSIVEVSATIGDTITVSGSNGTASATFQWQQSADGSTGWADISGETAASLDTSTGVTNDYFVRRGTTDGVQGPVYTAALQVAAVSAGIVDPNDLSAVVWLDFTDTSTLWQDTARTTAATTVSDPVRYVDNKGSDLDFRADVGDTPGNAVVISGGVDWNACGMRPTGNMTGLTTDMEVFALIQIDSDTTWQLLGRNASNANYAGRAFSADAGSPDSSWSGTIIHSVAGVDLTSPTRDDIYDAVVAEGSGYVIQSLRGIDLTQALTNGNLMPMSHTNTSVRFDGNIRHFIVVPTLTTGDRADMIAWLEAEAV